MLGALGDERVLEVFFATHVTTASAPAMSKHPLWLVGPGRPVVDHRSMSILRGFTLLLALSSPLVARAEGPPVVAVFSVRDASSRLKPDEITQLTSYLTARIAEGGRFQVVPQAQLRQVFGEQKAASYEACYDEACQIEIGREVAAQKTLSTEIVQLGQSCAVSATLYDLTRAASELAATERGACTIDALVESIDRIAQKISGVAATAPVSATPAPAPAPATRPDNALDVLVESTPEGAELLLDGKFIGATPLRVPMVPGQRYELRFNLEDHHSLATQLSYESESRLHYELTMTPEALRARTEWLAFSPLMSFSFGGNLMFGARAQLVGLRFGTFSWALVDGSLGAGSGEVLANALGRSETSLERAEGRTYFFAVGTRPGVSFALDEAGRHQLQAGLGLGIYYLFEDAEELGGDRFEPDSRDQLTTPLGFWPSVTYLFTTDSGFFMGVSVRAVIAPLVESGAPQLISIDLPLGFAG